MLAAVKFDRELGALTKEIGVETGQGYLAPELESLQLSAAQMLPQLAFSFCALPAHLSRPGRSFALQAPAILQPLTPTLSLWERGARRDRC